MQSGYRAAARAAAGAAAYAAESGGPRRASRRESAAVADRSVPASRSCEGELRRRKGVELGTGESDAVYAVEGGGTAA
ncbi:hypothetical protein J1605_007017 [Eschrichtius robustus]|nr:hypothetical protein J1605_007017 [Eschrichtius robustus]